MRWSSSSRIQEPIETITITKAIAHRNRNIIMAKTKIEKQPLAKTQSNRRQWVGMMSLIPIVCLVAIACFLTGREAVISMRLKDKLNAMRQAGEPVDNASLAKYFEGRSHKEGTEAWGEILALCRSADAFTSDLPIVGEGNLPIDFRPGSEWPIEPRVAEYLSDAKPILERISKADSFPKPVWMPIEFKGFYTSLELAQSSRTVTRILNLDACHALYKKDTERALKDIQSLRSVAEAFDWNLSLVTNMISFATSGRPKNIINRSLAMDVWNDEQLKLLGDMMKQTEDVSKTWSTAFTGEQAWVMAGFSDSEGFENIFGPGPINRLLSMPSAQLSFIESFEKIKTVGAEGFTSIATRATAVEKEILVEGDFLIGGLLPATTSIARFYVNHEVSRRLTLTAIGIKQFQRKYKRYPKALTELGEVGLVERDWTTTERNVLGYAVDGDVAYVWSAGFENGGKISEQVPISDENPPKELENMVMIR